MALYVYVLCWCGCDDVVACVTVCACTAQYGACIACDRIALVCIVLCVVVGCYVVTYVC